MTHKNAFLSAEADEIINDVVGDIDPAEYNSPDAGATGIPVEDGNDAETDPDVEQAEIADDGSVASESGKPTAKGGKKVPSKGKVVLKKKPVPAKGGKKVPTKVKNRGFEDGNEAVGEEGEPTENVIEDQDDLDLTNEEGGEYDSSEAVGAEDGDAVDVIDTAFDSVTDDDTDAGDEAGEGGDEGAGDDTDAGTEAGEGGDEGGDEGAGTDAGEEAPAEAPAASSDVPVESTDTTNTSGLDDEQVKEGAVAAESFFIALDRRATSFEDGEESILDEPEVANAEVPAPAAEEDESGNEGAGDDTDAGDEAGEGGDEGGDEVVVGDGSSGEEVANDTEPSTDENNATPEEDETSAESWMDIF